MCFGIGNADMQELQRLIGKKKDYQANEKKNEAEVLTFWFSSPEQDLSSQVADFKNKLKIK